MEVEPHMMPTANIKVVGVGGAGCKVLNRMVKANLQGVEFVAINTDAQDLHYVQADLKVHIGTESTKGLGSGGDASVGLRSAEENIEDIRNSLEGADMVFVVVGQGGGTGSQASSVVAQVAKEEVGALTVGVATKPFDFEGARRRKNADEGLVMLTDKVDALIVVPNDRLLGLIDKKTTLMNAFGIVDDVMYQAVSGVSELITRHGEMVNVDFADVKSIMQNAGSAHIGIGISSGENRAIDAAKAAIESPLLEVSMHGAKGILVNITGGDDLSMWEVDEAIKTIAGVADPEVNIIFGTVIDETSTGEIAITVVATGFADDTAPEAASASSAGFGARTSGLGGRANLRSNSFFNRSGASAPAASSAHPSSSPSTATSSDASVADGKDVDDPDVPAFIRRRMK